MEPFRLRALFRGATILVEGLAIFRVRHFSGSQRGAYKQRRIEVYKTLRQNSIR